MKPNQERRKALTKRLAEHPEFFTQVEAMMAEVQNEARSMQTGDEAEDAVVLENGCGAAVRSSTRWRPPRRERRVSWRQGTRHLRPLGPRPESSGAVVRVGSNELSTLA